jgi:hypothetical protein
LVLVSPLKLSLKVITHTHTRSFNQFEPGVHMAHRCKGETAWPEGDNIRGLQPLIKMEDFLVDSYHFKDGLVDQHNVVVSYINSAKRNMEGS